MITSAVMVQITTVSMNGSSSETKPSVIGSLVRTAECAIAAEPTPASFENAARRKPWISAPTMPPATPSPVKAPAKIWPKAHPIWSACIRMMTSAASTYMTPMKGTTFSVTRAMDFRPPTITANTMPAKTKPVIQPGIIPDNAQQSAACAWLAWNMLPPPNAPRIQKIENSTARILPPGRPSSAKPFGHVIHRTTRNGAVFGYSLRYFTPSVHSVNFDAMPSRPATIIQNVAPGPPIPMATATPAMLPKTNGARQVRWQAPESG